MGEFFLVCIIIPVACSGERQYRIASRMNNEVRLYKKENDTVYPWSYSGHRNYPGQKGLMLLSKHYGKIDEVLGPGSWSVTFREENGKVIASQCGVNIEICPIDETISQYGLSWNDLLLQDLNIIKFLSGGECHLTWRNCQNQIIRTWMKQFNVSFRYEDNSRAHGYHGFSATLNGESYCSCLCWPWKIDQGYKVAMESLKLLIKGQNIKIKMML